MSKKGLHPFVATKVLDNFMFGYVFGVRQFLPSVSIDKAIVQFMRAFDVSEDMMNPDSAKRQYIRMEHQFVKYLQKDDGTNGVGN